MNKEEFINEFNDWTKEEILGRAFEICCKNIELKEIEKEHQKINGDLRIEIKELKEKYMKLEDKYIHNVSCCNEKDCDLFCELQELKDRIDKAIEYIYDNDLFHEEYNGGCNCYFSSDSQEKKDLLDLLKGDKE